MTRVALPLWQQCEAAGLPAPDLEWRFHPTRRWRFDLAWPDHGRLAVEIDGAIYVSGRHTRGAGVEKDMEKLNEAACLGWTVLRVSPGMVQSGAALGWIERALALSADVTAAHR